MVLESLFPTPFTKNRFCTTVVSLLIVNSDGISPSSFDSVFESTGLKDLSYSPSASSLTYTEWPTLSSLIGNGTRLVTFMDSDADFSSVPYIIDGRQFVIH